jgi:hypothetical protein
MSHSANKGKGGKKKQRRKKKDPNAPLRPKSAYMFFMQENRADIIARKNLDKKKITDVGRAVGQAWAGMSNKDKKPYQAKSDADKARYQKDLKNWEKTKGPKKPMSAYMFYVQDTRPRLQKENPSFGFSALGKLLGTGWKALSKPAKGKLEKKATLDKERYKAECIKGGFPLKPVKKASTSKPKAKAGRKKEAAVRV